jgi:hypothetical protein
MKGSGSLIIKLEYNTKSIHGARITIPLLGIDEHMGKLLQLDHIPAGTYPGTLILYRSSGAEIRKPIKAKIFPNQQNTYEFNFNSVANDVLIRPVDSRNKTILFSEIKIENVDPNFRLVRDEAGLPCRLAPGNYQVKLVLPDMTIKNFPLKVVEDSLVYTLPVDQETGSSRHEPRFHLSVPVVYRTTDGRWISTNSTDISSTGICLIKGQRKITDKELYLRLFVPISKVPVECYAKVRWMKEDAATDARMGLQLLLPENTKTTLSKWLSEASATRNSTRPSAN